MLFVFWQEASKVSGFWDTAKLPTEVITVEGVQYLVPLRFDHPLSSEIVVACYLVSITR